MDHVCPGSRRPALAWQRCGYRLLIALLTGLSVLVARSSAPASVAEASSTNWVVNLGEIGFGTLVLDSKRGHIFVSGSTRGAVAILSYGGRPATVLRNLPGA